LILGSEGFRFDDERARARLAALRMPRPPVTLPGGHHVHLEQPQEVARVVEALVSETR
jgi:pimeloyl-ACP methyl ester carboxylesterase